MSIQSQSTADTEANRKIRDEIIAYMAEHQAEIMESLGIAVRSGNWLAENSKRITREHPDEWVAVRETVVLAHDPELTALHQKLDELGYAPSDALITFLPAKPIKMSL